MASLLLARKLKKTILVYITRYILLKNVKDARKKNLYISLVGRVIYKNFKTDGWR